MISKRLLSIAALTLALASCTKQSVQKPDKASGPAARIGLEKFVDRDLRELDAAAAEELGKEITRLNGDEPEQHRLRSFEPWRVWRFPGGRAKWVLLEAYPGPNVPDVSAVRIHVFDEQWAQLFQQSFPTGYRFFLNDVTLDRDNPLGTELIVAKTTCAGPFVLQNGEKHPAFEQGDFQFQYYGLLDNQFVLVRLVDNDGHLVRNNYCWSSPPKGPPVPRRSGEQWIRSLASENPVEQLATLVWLSGVHLPSTQARREDTNEEGVEDSRLFEDVRDSPATRSALESVASSKNPWVAEYAKLAAGIP